MISCYGAIATAETLRDPTQLPSEFASPEMNTDFQSSATSRGPVLQSIILSDEVRAAIISGNRINLGEQYNKAKLVALTENSATLLNGDGNKTILKMPHIGIKKTEETAIENLVDKPLMATKSSQPR